MSNKAPTLRKSGLARLVIADDHELARAGLRTMLIGQSWVELIGEAKNGREALAICRRLQPDLALIDVRMPDLDGLATCRSIKKDPEYRPHDLYNTSHLADASELSFIYTFAMKHDCQV